MANKAYVYRIYPTKEQSIWLAKNFGCCRKIWNLMLDDKINYYHQNKAMLHNTPAMYKEKYPFLKEADSLALANVQLNLQEAYSSFFKKKAKFPKFKSKKYSKNSYTTNNQNGSVAVLEHGIKLPKAGVIKAVIHRKAPKGYKLKSATIHHNPDDTYTVSVLYEYDAVVTQTKGSSAIGLDYKSDGLYVDSDGNCCDMPHYYRRSQEKLAKSQKSLSRKTYGSRNYEKQCIRVAKVHSKISHQRKDYLHKLSTAIAKQYDIVCIEDLNMRSMANHRFHNGKATLDNGYGMFINMLEYKLHDKGKSLIRIDKWYPSSQICSHCGGRQPMPLSVRTYRCPSCGNVMDRDYNSAINILNEGLRIYHSA